MMRRDVTRGDTARTGSENEADGISAGIGGHVHVFEIGVAANLDPHGGQPCRARDSEAGVLTERSSSSRAAPGFGWRMSDSPMRKASKPARRQSLNVGGGVDAALGNVNCVGRKLLG